MATGLIQQVQVDNGDLNNIASTVYGICNTGANDAAKTVTIDGFELIPGTTIYVKFTANNTVLNPTLNVNGSGALNILLNSGANSGVNDATNGWYAGSILILTYDGFNWIRSAGDNTNASYTTITLPEIETGTSTAGQLISAKVLKDVVELLTPAPSGDTQVSQVGTNEDVELSILLKCTNNTTDETTIVKYGNVTNNLVTVNPYTGILSATGFSGSGANLTNIPYSALSIPNGSISNDKLANYSITIGGETVNLGGSITLSDLGLSNAMHFIGIVLSTSQYTPSDGLNQIPDIADVPNYTPTAGDVVIDRDESREYVYTKGNTWEVLGQDASTTYSITLSPYERITSISQDSDRIISVTKGTIETLPIAYGGTGVNSFSANQVILSSTPVGNEDMTLISRAYKDSQSNNAILSNSNNFVTERYIYYGLPTINNEHDYTAETEIYAPVTEGIENHILISGGVSSAPVWTIAATLSSEVSSVQDAAAYDILTLGNSNSISTTSSHSQGLIHLYSSGTAYTELISQATDNYSFYLPAYTGNMYAVHVGSNSAVGDTEQPVYVSANGRVMSTSYALKATLNDGTTNTLSYYSSARALNSTGHYASTTAITVNGTTAPANNGNFQVIGTSTMQTILPQINNSYSLGSSSYRWSAIYLGEYGDPYQPIYWNDGTPAITYPVQYFTWIISQGKKGVTLTGNNIFTNETYNVTLVVVDGESNLNGPLTWTSSANTFSIESTVPTTGQVSGYAIVARGDDITTSLSRADIS